MKKDGRSKRLVMCLALAAVILVAVTAAHAAQYIVIPYGYVENNWDTVIVVSNISNSTINPQIVVRNNATGGSTCVPLAALDPGEIYWSTFGNITGWCTGIAPQIPGIFQVYVGADELAEGADPFGVAIAINNSSFGGYSFQQYKSEFMASAPSVFSSCTCEAPSP